MGQTKEQQNIEIGKLKDMKVRELTKLAKNLKIEIIDFVI